MGSHESQDAGGRCHRRRYLPLRPRLLARLKACSSRRYLHPHHPSLSSRFNNHRVAIPSKGGSIYWSNDLADRALTQAPVNKISVEFPAGLIDGGETPEQAALRELAEETGYGSNNSPATQGKVTHISKVCADSPGMSTETTVFVIVKVELDDTVQDFPKPKQDLDEGEFVSHRIASKHEKCSHARTHQIEKRIVPIKDLFDTLEAYAELGYIVDTRLHHFALELKLASALV